MKKTCIVFLFFFLLNLSLTAQRGSSKNPVSLKEVTVSARRTLSNIGVQKTELDSASLRENITNSLADVLSQNSTIFIKSYGRATLSTASFRGTSPSHTQVSWNNIKLNSPMLGMVDFSLIPSYFIDDANLFHGASSTGTTGGGLGGAITLSTKPAEEEGLGIRYIQGISSYNTLDEFGRITYGNDKWQSSTRVLYSTSDNDFKYTNYRKKDYILDEQGEISGYKRPVEKNKNGEFKDLHLLQEIYYNTGKGNRFGAYAWYMDSERGVPMLNVDYNDEKTKKNKQFEKTLRAGLSWDKAKENLMLKANAGYVYTDMKYLYLADPGSGILSEMIHSQSYVNTGSLKFNAEYFLNDKWLFIATLEGAQHKVDSRDRAIITSSGQKKIIGYNKGRFESSGFVSVKYNPTDRLGLAINLREDFYGSKFTPLIPAAFADYIVSKKGNVVVKASIARNYRYPTLNDLYFMPGGNDSLKTEKGFTYDGGFEFTLKNDNLKLWTEITAFNSHIHDWILWLPTFKGFWSPMNVKKVNSYGLEVKTKFSVQLGKNWALNLDGNYALTKSINHGDPVNWADESIGKQLVYIPVHSSAMTARLSWRKWVFAYKWNFYSERFTTSSNETKTRIGLLGDYYMNDISLEKSFSFRLADCSFKFAINNLFDEEYESVLSRPMAGRNFGFFIGLTPKFWKK